MRNSWTDERLDDLARRMDLGFEGVNARFEQVDRRFDRIDARFDALQRTMLQTGGVIVAALLGVIATQL